LRGGLIAHYFSDDAGSHVAPTRSECIRNRTRFGGI
jgi:hypothetical protein